MSKSIFAVAVTATLCAITSAWADTGYELLFAKTGGQLAIPDQQAIYQMMGLVRKGKELQAKDVPDCGALEVGEVQLQDINGDGAPEVFVNIGSTCLYGAAGNGISLFIKSKTGAWQRELGFAAMLSAVLPQKSKGYADLRVGGPGFCEEVLRWDGKTYKHYKNVATAPGGCSGH
jgi:hypothetical protein